MNLNVKHTDRNTQAPHVALFFVVNREKALLSFEGRGACTGGPWPATKVFDDLARGCVGVRTAVRWAFSAKVHDRPVDWSDKEACVLWDAPRRISKPEKKPGGCRKQQDAKKWP